MKDFHYCVRGGLLLKPKINGRTKGKAYENHVAALMRNAGFEEAKRHLEFQIQEGNQGRDLDGTQPFCVQCKCYGKTPSIVVMNEIIPTEEYPFRVAFLKKTRSKSSPGMHVAVVDVDLFLAMIGILKENDLLKELQYGI